MEYTRQQSRSKGHQYIRMLPKHLRLLNSPLVLLKSGIRLPTALWTNEIRVSILRFVVGFCGNTFHQYYRPMRKVFLSWPTRHVDGISKLWPREYESIERTQRCGYSRNMSAERRLRRKWREKRNKELAVIDVCRNMYGC